MQKNVQKFPPPVLADRHTNRDETRWPLFLAFALSFSHLKRTRESFKKILLIHFPPSYDKLASRYALRIVKKTRTKNLKGF